MSSAAALESDVAALVARARTAQRQFASSPQEFVDLACLAAGWALLEPEANRRLSNMAVEETGFGNAADKEIKNRRKTLGLLRDIRGQKTVGVIRDEPARGLVEIARPVGVVAALTPSTNPLATPVNKTINALKGGNAVILAPPPKGAKVGALLLERIRAELETIGAPPDLVQMLLPPSKEAAACLMTQADLVVVTGSQRNVRAAVASGTPTIGVGAGNVAAIVDETADLDGAAEKIAASKTFDNATSCSSENHLIVVGEVYDSMLAALQKQGGALLSGEDKQRLQKHLWQDGALNRELVARDLPVFAERAGLDDVAPGTRFLMAEEEGAGAAFPFSSEKLSLALTLYRAENFAAAKARAAELLNHQGAGHSVGIHTGVESRPLELGLELPACRVIVNQAHCFANGGAFNNALPFSLSMGCGTWGKNIVGDNVNYRHYLNIVRVVRPIAGSEPAAEEIFGEYWSRRGK